MATTETLDLSESTEKGEVVNGEQTEANTEKTSGGGVDGSTAAAGLDGPLGESSSASPSPGSGLVPLKGVAPNGISSGAVNPPILSMPHPKKFSHVNINKKFLEKTSSTSTSGQTLSTSAVTKTVSSQKPVAQTAPSHSRLVTTKLTASPQPSTTTGPGWSRPSSAVPSGAITPLSATNVIPPPLPSSATASHSAPVPAPVGKVIQPQPRGPPEAAIGSVKKEGAGKSVWANTKLTAAVVSKPDRVQAEFPTAAEIAQGRIAKLAEKNQFTEAAAAHKQAVMAEEDTFRGVHLDPNAHHWDEMEEDDDNFLDGVIEFEDGRQYKVQPAEAARVVADVDNELAKHLETSPPDHPVSKEERFGDDFDRSWPRSRPAANPPPHREHYPNGPASASSSQSLRSPQDSSRVLFNERSNRLEPYSNSQPPRHNGPGTSSYSGRRANRSEYAGSQTELRGGRDAPPHSHLQGVQLLQKGSSGGDSGVDGPSHFRGSGDLSPTSPNEGSRYRDRETMHRENPPLHGYQMDRAPSHGVEQGYSRDHYNPFEVPVAGSSGPGREGYADDRARRSSTMGPPPLPLIVPSDSAQDHTRQLPPHLSNMRPMHLTPLRTRTSRESLSGRSATELSSTTAPSAHQESHTSAVSHASTSPSSVVDKPLPSSTLPLMDMDEVRKAAMHSAAERARIRRQQEEDEREKEKERARRKAAELEAKMNAEKAKKDTEAEAVGFIEEAVRSIALSESGAFKPDTGASDSHAPLNRTLSNRPTFGHVPSSRGIIGSSSNYHTSFASSAAGSDLPFEGDSWRSRVALVTHTSPVAAVLPAHLPLLGSVDLTVKIDDDLEVVDFSELGKLMGAGLPSHAETSRTDPNHTVSARPPRSVAADFFDEYSHASRDSMPPRSEESSWRRRTSLPLESTSSDKPSTSVPTTAKEVLKVQSMKLDVPRVMEVSTASSSQASSSSSAKHADEQYRQSSGFNSSHAQNGYGPLKSPLPPSYREAPMSTLNDVISRIKGALDGMHTHAEPPMQQKWLPPALRLKATVSEHNAPHEVFDITGCEPPRSPKPAWNHFVVRFPPISQRLEPVSRRQYQLSSSQSFVRADIFSWNPPIEGGNRRDFTLNSMLFGRPRMMKGQPRYFVSLPQTRHSGLNRIDEGASAPVVNLPSAPPRLNDSSSRENSGSSSWRRTPSTSPWNSRQPDAAQSPHELDTVSRSPPPEAPSSESRMPSLAKDDRVESPSISGVSVKMRSQPKMPAGSDVAFYRDTRVNSAVQPTPSVKFIVTSELEGDVSSESNRESVSLPISPLNGALDAPHPSSSGPKITGPSTSISTEKDEPGRSTQPFGQRPATPLQSAGTPWMKSPRAFSNKDFAPDPEHLKAVWSQASDKAELPSTNSLEGIADDLTAVPFTLQDVKSEDGETPPPSVSGPSSRMNSYDVTRAFQQVPSSSSSSSSRAPIPLGSPTNGSVPRHSAFSFSPPMSNANLRPAYPAYGSPLLSPSPSVMYPMQASPIPRPMVLNGGSPAYAQQVWVPVPGPAPPTPGGMMRPLGSPYPQMVPYPSAGGTMPMYGPPPPNMHTGPSQQSNGMQGRSSGMPVMSPVMQQTHPMYGGSPVLMSNLAAGQTYPGAMQPMRAQMRGGFDHAPGMSLMPPSMGHPPPTGGYAPVPSNSFPRPTW